MEIGIALEIIKEYGGLAFFAVTVVYFLYRCEISITYEPPRKKE